MLSIQRTRKRKHREKQQPQQQQVCHKIIVKIMCVTNDWMKIAVSNDSQVIDSDNTNTF